MMNSVVFTLSVLGALVVGACGGDSPPPKNASDEAGEEGSSSKPGTIDRAHENFKRGVRQTVDGAATAAEKARRNVQKAGREGGRELGVRESVLGGTEEQTPDSPAPAGSADRAAPSGSSTPAAPAPSASASPTR